MTQDVKCSEKRRKHDMQKLLLCILGFILSVCVFTYRINEYRGAEESYRLLQHSTVQMPQPVEASVPIHVDFEQLQRMNEDIVGWIYAEGIGVDYPILQGENDQSYLRRLYNGRTNVAGSIFLDQRCDPDMTGKHLIVYGHKMRNGTMFGQLNRYADSTFYQEHPTFYILTPEKNYRVDVVSAYRTTADSEAYRVDFEDETEWETYLDGILSKSLYHTDVQSKHDKQLITLSTCSYETKNARFVVHGVMVEL